jgi:hypothetical protein
MKVIKKLMFFCHFSNYIGFPVKGKLISTKIRFVMHLLQNPPLCSGTTYTSVYGKTYLLIQIWEKNCVASFSSKQHETAFSVIKVKRKCVLRRPLAYYS